MNIKQTIRNIAGGLFLVIGIAVASTTFMPIASAACDPNTQSCCGGVETSILTCTEDGTGTDVNNSGAWGILLFALNILTAGVGVVALGGVVYGAILYISAGGSQEQVKKAMGIFTNVVIGVIAFAAMFALLNFLVPGGLFSGTRTTNTVNTAPGGTGTNTDTDSDTTPETTNTTTGAGAGAQTGTEAGESGSGRDGSRSREGSF